MMRTYIATIGYDSTRVIRPILGRGIQAGDDLLILRPEQSEYDERATEALTDVKNIVDEISPTITLEVIDIPFAELHEAIIRCIELITDTEGETTVILGGGARDIYFPLSVATLIQRDAVNTILQFSDITGEVSELDVPNFFVSLSESELETLRALAAESTLLTLDELTNRVGRSKSTVARHVNRFEEVGFVDTDTDGRSKVIELNSTGEVYLTARPRLNGA